VSVSQRRAAYPLQQRLRIYGPETMARQIDQSKRRKSALTVRGVNILNKSDLETDNNLINELASSMDHRPTADESNKAHRAQILRDAVVYIRNIQAEVVALRAQL
ncbi:hypothetical protein BCR43DRAFT_413181, partial [Syncephalastrum racemosum]